VPRPTQPQIARLGVGIILLVPAGLLLGLGLVSGGFFPDSVSVAVIAVILIFVVRAVSSPTAFSGVGIGFSLVAAALIAFATWTLISGSWSGSPARAVFEYNRMLLYTAVFVLSGVLGRSAIRARVLLYGVTVVSVGISAVAAATWVLPDLLPVASDVGRERLSWPTSYWNATGLIAALGLVWASSLSCSSSEPARVRVLAAMGAPLAAATLIFTVSRGAVAVAALGMVLAVVTIRSSATPGGLITLVPAIAVSVVISLALSGLNVDKPMAHAVHAGHRTAILLAGVAVAAAAMRMALLALDVRLARARAPWTLAQLRVGLAVGAAVFVVAFLILGGPSAVRTAVHKFVAPETQVVNGNLPARQRLTQLGSNGRVGEWRVAFDDGFLRHPLKGIGAGTYATLSTRYSTTFHRVLNAHSLYIEELAELGIIGGALLVASIASMLIALAFRARGAERHVWAALLAGSVMWALHAGVDWDWQMPAVTAWFFAAGGLALAAPADRPQRETHPRVRLAVGFGCLLLAVTPAAVWRSQTQIIKAVGAFERGDCLTAEHAALASNAALGSRWDPFEVVSYCEAGAGRYLLALNAIEAAEHRDPQNWELRYSHALISAAAGFDPRPAAHLALTLYPTSPLVVAAVRAFSRGGHREWSRFAKSAPLPLPWARQK
jgi:O-Antigen ligase